MSPIQTNELTARALSEAEVTLIIIYSLIHLAKF